ncbi:MAG: O-antigen ligase family protein [Rothia sp. (in: high G+C Gram-positive bacteria)]|nr:O-antigen ligase family protein [Rothia sp. (in: high G+C Gram-positive bacteria)]
MHRGQKAAQAATKETWVDRRLEQLVFLAICFTPFQLALTLNLGGSPLKISELLLGLAIALFPFSSWVKRRPAGQLPLLLFSLVFIVSALIHYVGTATSLPLLARGYTRSQTGDIIFYTVFTLFALLAWKVLASLERAKIERALIIASWLCIGAVLFQALGVASGNLGLVEALGFESQGRVEDRLVSTRNGPFKEGQHLGFFTGSLLILALYRRRFFTALGLLACIFYSQSTTAILGLGLALLLVLILRASVSTVSLFLGSLLVLFLSFAFITPFRDFVYLQLEKLGFSTAANLGERYTVSLDVRSLKSEIGFEIMQDFPLLGVGPGRYSIYFFDYPQSFDMPYYYFRDNHRAIAENIYAQVAAEFGLFGFAFFLLFLLALAWQAFKSRQAGLLGFAAFVLFGISTQSTLTFLPIWVFFALLASSPGPLPASQDSAPAGEEKNPVSPPPLAFPSLPPQEGPVRAEVS